MGKKFHHGDDGVDKDGAEKDRLKTFYWYTKAADYIGQEEAEFKLGNCYYFGEGISQDYDKAAE